MRDAAALTWVLGCLWSCCQSVLTPPRVSPGKDMPGELLPVSMPYSEPLSELLPRGWTLQRYGTAKSLDISRAEVCRGAPRSTSTRRSAATPDIARSAHVREFTRGDRKGPLVYRQRLFSMIRRTRAVPGPSPSAHHQRASCATAPWPPGHPAYSSPGVLSDRLQGMALAG